MESGDEATSMRAITSAAELNLASVNYHFGSKEGLLREVFRRRLAWLNKERIAALDLLNGPFKSVVAGAARKQVAKRARLEHYPAPCAIIELWARHSGNALAAPDLIDSIVRSSTARNLVSVFFLQERLKSFGKTGGGFQAKHVHVVGAGVMGGDIAAWCALRGLRVTLLGREWSVSRLRLPVFTRPMASNFATSCSCTM